MKFDVIHRLAERLNRINLDAVTEDALVNNQSEISELNREQLRDGVRATGTFLPDYSPVSVKVYGKPPGPIKLYETGDFYEGIVPKFSEMNFTLEGTDEKTDMLERRYGEVVGLTKESIGDLARVALPDIQNQIRRRL